MNARLTFRPEAVAELREAFQWYESQRRGLGRAFLQAVRSQIGFIREDPRRYPCVLRTIRRATIRRFPYGIYYEAQSDAAVVLAVQHFNRSPDGWTSRG